MMQVDVGFGMEWNGNSNRSHSTGFRFGVGSIGTVADGENVTWMKQLTCEEGCTYALRDLLLCRCPDAVLPRHIPPPSQTSQSTDGRYTELALTLVSTPFTYGQRCISPPIPSWRTNNSMLAVTPPPANPGFDRPLVAWGQ